MPVFHLSPSDARALQAAKRRRRLWLAIGTGLLLVLVIGLRPGVRSARHWRARQLAAQAETLAAEHRWPEAVGKAQAAYQVAPAEPAAVRAICHLYSVVGRNVALGYWKCLTTLPEVTAEDRREAARFALRSGAFDFAEAQSNAVLQGDPADIGALEIAVQIALARGGQDAALAAIQRLLAQDPAHPVALLTQAQVLLSSPDPNRQREGRAALRKLATERSAVSLAALEALARAPHLPMEDCADLAQQLEVHPDAKTDDRLLAVTLLLRAYPERRSDLISGAVQRFRAGTPEDLIALGRWTLQQNESARVLGFLNPAAAASRPELFLIRADALATVGSWAEIQHLLEQKNVPLDLLHKEIFLARAATELREDREAELHWGSALSAAGQRPNDLAYVAQYAEKSGARRFAESAWRQLALSPAWRVRADLALIPLLQLDGDTRGLRSLLNDVVRLLPNDPAPRNDIAYLDLLLGENIAAARQTAERLTHDHPEVMAYRATLALALLRTGEIASARRIFRTLEVPWEETSTRAQAIRAAVLAADGEPVLAKAAVEHLAAEQLLPEERSLLAGLVPALALDLTTH